MLFDKLYVAEQLGLTLWPCRGTDDMHPLERRLWVQFLRLVKGARSAVDSERMAELITTTTRGRSDGA